MKGDGIFGQCLNEIIWLNFDENLKNYLGLLGTWTYQNTVEFKYLLKMLAFELYWSFKKLNVKLKDKRRKKQIRILQ